MSKVNKGIRKQKQGLQSRAEVTREAILKGATHILEKDGLSAFNTNTIADKAGISVGSLYQYFGCKEAILKELVNNSINQRVNHVTQILEKRIAEKMTAKEAVETVIEASMQTPETHPVVDQILFDLNHMMLKNEKINTVDERLMPYLKNYLQTYFPEVKTKEIELVLKVVMSATRGVVSQAQMEGFNRFSKKAIKAELSKMVFLYLNSI